MTFLAGFTVTVIRPAVDAYGDPVETSRSTVSDCGMLHHSTSEDVGSGEQVSETATLAAPPWADIRATDVVLLPDDTRWHVVGRSHVPASPLSGWEPAQVVPLRRVTG